MGAAGKIDHAAAIANFQKAAEGGNAGAQNTLGMMYYSGSNMGKNTQKAYDLFQKAADQNHPDAKNNLVAVKIELGLGSISLEISENDGSQLWIPPGFAHGFSVLSDEVIFSYKCTNYYSKSDERTILYNDPDLNIDWKVKDPIVSEKDLKAKLFKEIENDFVYDPV